jgi:hypothetical protein
MVPGEGIEPSWVPRVRNLNDRVNCCGLARRFTVEYRGLHVSSAPNSHQFPCSVPLRVPVGLRQGVHSPGLVLLGNLGVDRRGLDAGVAELLLDDFRVGAPGPVERWVASCGSNPTTTMRPVTARQTPSRVSALPWPVKTGTPGCGILRLLGIVEEPAPPGRFRDRRRLDAEGRCQGATGAAEDRHPEGGDADPRAHSGT